MSLGRQTVITVQVEQADIDAARPMGWCCTTGDAVARAVCRLFHLPLGSVSVGIDRIEVYDGDAAEGRWKASYLLDEAGAAYIAAYDANRRAARPATFEARLDMTIKLIRQQEDNYARNYALAGDTHGGAAIIRCPAL